MGILSVLGLGKDYDPEDDRLAAPLHAEATDLALHVERCAGRYQQIRKSQHANSQRIIILTVMGIVQLVVLLLSQGEKATKVLAAIL